MTTNNAIIWTISGADCSGGAGIAADIKTAHALGVEICSLITANTVQNSQHVISVNPTSCDVLTQQVNVLLTDKPPNAIKIGLLVNLEQVHWLTTTLLILKAQIPALKVIYDPVAQASVGGVLSTVTANDLTELLPLVDIITPNWAEAKSLVSLDANTDIDKPEKLATNIQKLGVNTVIIKGGHATSKVCEDYCFEAQESGDILIYQLRSTRINSDYSHGGGCTFASAIAALIAQGYLIRDAFTLAKAYINQGLSYHENKLGYYGAFEQGALPTNAEHFPQNSAALVKQYQQLDAFKSLMHEEANLGLYPVVDSLAWLQALLPLGLEIIQLRIKNKTDEELDAIIAEAVALCQHSKTRLFINDYWQLAIKHKAYGVHIGQEDLQDADLVQIHAAGLRLGISTHGCYEFILAQQLKPSYLAIGAIFPTRTKDMTGQIQGLANLRHILNSKTNIPVVAIGGITLKNVEDVWQTGVDSVAVVTAITEAKSPSQAVKDFQTKLQQ